MKKYCWDTNVLLAWLQKEPLPDEEMEGIKQHIEEIERKNIGLIIPVIVYTEMFQAIRDAERYAKFCELLKKEAIQNVSIDTNIAKLAGNLRAHYKNNPKNKESSKTLSTPDSIFLATSIIHKVDCFHTLDQRDKRGKEKSLGLLPLNGDTPAGHLLTIAKPPLLDPQLCLPFARDE